MQKGTMMFRTLFLVGLALTSSALSAKVMVLTASGKVTDLRLSKDGVFSAPPVGMFGVGDTFHAVAKFDTELVQIGSVSDADPTTNVYFLIGPYVKISIGSYSTAYTPKFLVSSSLQMWNNRPIGSFLVDSQSFEFSNYDFSTQPPFDIGGGLNAELFSLQAYDFSGTARSSDLISELAGTSALFGSNSISYSYSSGPNPLVGSRPAVLAQIGGVAWTLSPMAVPEPDTWVTMLLGFWAIGFGLRQKRAYGLRPSSE